MFCEELFKLKLTLYAKFRCCWKYQLFPFSFFPLPKKYPTKLAGKNLGTSSFGRRKEGRRMVFGKRGGGKREEQKFAFPQKFITSFPSGIPHRNLEELIKRSPFVLWKQKKGRMTFESPKKWKSHLLDKSGTKEIKSFQPPLSNKRGWK